MIIPIKPLSVNKCWQGRRFKTPEYNRYIKEVNLLLPTIMEIPEGDIEISFIFYVSNRLADWDNPIKPLQDIIAKKYGFNDAKIFKGSGEKVLVSKGEERVEFIIKKLVRNV